MKSLAVLEARLASLSTKLDRAAANGVQPTDFTDADRDAVYLAHAGAEVLCWLTPHVRDYLRVVRAMFRTLPGLKGPALNQLKRLVCAAWGL